ncbi:MAG: hypothetical protein Q9M92_04745 [Enterobacterales bacterium]|nr:hypothetical protein [Enterobacterales bacterium]
MVEKLSSKNDVEPQSSDPSWVKTSDCLPLRSGLYYISNGASSDIAFFNQKTQDFSKTHNEIFVDFWCIDHGEILPPKS